MPGKKHAWPWLWLVACALLMWLRGADAPADERRPPLVVELGRRLVVPGSPDAFVEDAQIAGVLALGSGTLVITPHRAGRTRLGWRAPAPGWRELIVTTGPAWPLPPPAVPAAPIAAALSTRQSEPPRHTLGGVLGTGDRRVALVDGKPVGLGDAVGDMVVETIEDSRVVLKGGQVRAELVLAPR